MLCGKLVLRSQPSKWAWKIRWTPPICVAQLTLHASFYSENMLITDCNSECFWWALDPSALHLFQLRVLLRTHKHDKHGKHGKHGCFWANIITLEEMSMPLQTGHWAFCEWPRHLHWPVIYMEIWSEHNMILFACGMAKKYAKMSKIYILCSEVFKPKVNHSHSTLWFFGPPCPPPVACCRPWQPPSTRGVGCGFQGGSPQHHHF